MIRDFYVYVMSNRTHVLYIGVTNHFQRVLDETGVALRQDSRADTIWIGWCISSTMTTPSPRLRERKNSSYGGEIARLR